MNTTVTAERNQVRTWKNITVADGPLDVYDDVTVRVTAVQVTYTVEHHGVDATAVITGHIVASDGTPTNAKSWRTIRNAYDHGPGWLVDLIEQHEPVTA